MTTSTALSTPEIKFMSGIKIDFPFHIEYYEHISQFVFQTFSFSLIKMSHQLCQNCGSNQFEHIDGRLYCVICQSQNISLQIHVSFANEGNAQLGRRVRDQAQTTSDT